MIKVLVTGSAGHLGEGLVRTLRDSAKYEVVGIDILESPFTDIVGSIADRSFVAKAMEGVKVVFHTATLHKPHIISHTRQNFVDTNISGTLNLLEEAVFFGVEAFIYTSTTSVFGDALKPPPDAPAIWVTEDVTPVPKNIYGVTKLAAENMCQLFQRNHGLPCMVLRTSRFFPEGDDEPHLKSVSRYSDANLKVNEYLHRRVDIEDIINAHILASERAAELGFRTYIISASTPFLESDMVDIRADVCSVLQKRLDEKYFIASEHTSSSSTVLNAPKALSAFDFFDWKVYSTLGRVYSNKRAIDELNWQPKCDFQHYLDELGELRLKMECEHEHDPSVPLKLPIQEQEVLLSGLIKSSMAKLVGKKLYHRKMNEIEVSVAV